MTEHQQTTLALVQRCREAREAYETENQHQKLSKMNGNATANPRLDQLYLDWVRTEEDLHRHMYK